MKSPQDPSSQDLVQAYLEFEAAEMKSPSLDTRDSTQRLLAELLNPSPLVTYLKFFGGHLFLGVLSLGYCHQFGINPFGTSWSLADWFMSMGGHHFCMLACGFVFFGGTLLFAPALLSFDERRVFRTYFWTYLAVTIASSLLAFIFAAEAISLHEILPWLAGGLLAFILALYFFNSPQLKHLPEAS